MLSKCGHANKGIQDDVSTDVWAEKQRRGYVQCDTQSLKTLVKIVPDKNLSCEPKITTFFLQCASNNMNCEQKITLDEKQSQRDGKKKKVRKHTV